jgi:hypothetical protein
MKKLRVSICILLFSLSVIYLAQAQEVDAPRKYNLKTVSVGYGYQSQFSVYFDQLFLKNKRIQLGYQVGIGKRELNNNSSNIISYDPSRVYNYGSLEGWSVPITAYMLFGRASHAHHFGLGLSVNTIYLDRSFSYISSNNTISSTPIPDKVVENSNIGLNHEFSLPLMYRYQSPKGGLYVQIKAYVPVYTLRANSGYNGFYYGYGSATSLNRDNPFTYAELQVGWTFKNKKL